ncbi:zinc-dependent peptidase [Flavobacterium faecale]|uniref:zinc-dependent peptidase n=1 Tax=Flavobacterium faecale TaxID=1355330 RepID=UPI003AAE764E
MGHSIQNDNINLGLHEFAHVLHFHCLRSDEISAAAFQDGFVEVMKYFKEEQLNAKLVQKGYFRLYAYQNQFEFLAVILEHFFETPDKFKKAHPELYHSVLVMLNFEAIDLSC